MKPSFLYRVVSTCIIAISLSAPAWADVSYRIIDLGTLVGGVSSKGEGISENGQVTGSSYINGNEHQHAFLYDGTGMHDLGTLGGKESAGRGINDSGQVTGFSDIEGGSAYHAFLHDGTSMHDLGTLPGYELSIGTAINNIGQVTGTNHIPLLPESHAFLYDGTTMQDLGTLGARQSFGNDINASGQVTGWIAERTVTEHAFLYDGTTMHDLGVPPWCDDSDFSNGNGISDNGQVTGIIVCAPGQHAFLYDGTDWQDIHTLGLGALGGEFSHGNDVNNGRQVVGQYTLGATGEDRAFLYDGSTMHDLCELVDCVSAGWDSLTSANGINNRGSIAGTGVIGGNEHAFLVIAQLRIHIDIRPFAPINFINPRSRLAIWVAALSDTGSNAGSQLPFDPASQIDIQKVELGQNGARADRVLVKDINRDGIGDLLLRFKIAETGIACGDKVLTLTGSTFDGQSFTGTDSIKTVGCKY